MIQTLFGSLDEEQKAQFPRAHEGSGHAHAREPERAHRRSRFHQQGNRPQHARRTRSHAASAPTWAARPRRKSWASCARKPTASRSGTSDELKRLLKEELLAILNAANTRPVQKVTAPGSHPGRRRERNRQDHDHRQAVAGFSLARKNGTAVRSRHFSRRRHRATGNLGPAHRDGSDPHQSRAAIPRPCFLMRCKRRRRGTPIT